MGRSQTCNFQIHIETTGSTIYACTGAMSKKDITGLFLSEQEYQQTKGHQVIKLIIWAQTATGRKFLKGYDYAEMHKPGQIEYKYILTEQ